MPHVAVDGGPEKRLRRGNTAEKDDKQKELRLYPLLCLAIQRQLVLLEEQ